jgi:hypothetical protein
MDSIDIIVIDQSFDLLDPGHFFKVLNFTKLAPFGVSTTVRSTSFGLFD